MKDPQLKQQMSDFGKRKSYGPGDPPKKKKNSTGSPKPEPVAQINSYNHTIDRVRAQYGKTHTVRSANRGKLGDLTLTSKKTGYSVSMTPESNEDRANRVHQAKNPKPKVKGVSSAIKAKPVQSVEQKKTSSFTVKKGKQLDMDTRKAVAAGKKVNKIEALKKRKADKTKSNADRRAAFEAKQTAKIAKRVEAKRLAKKNKKK